MPSCNWEWQIGAFVTSNKVVFTCQGDKLTACLCAQCIGQMSEVGGNDVLNTFVCDSLNDICFKSCIPFFCLLLCCMGRVGQMLLKFKIPAFFCLCALIACCSFFPALSQQLCSLGINEHSNMNGRLDFQPTFSHLSFVEILSFVKWLASISPSNPRSWICCLDFRPNCLVLPCHVFLNPAVHAQI